MLDNRKEKESMYLMQDSFYIKKDASYDFSALMCDGTFFSAYKECAKKVHVKVLLTPLGNPNDIIASQLVTISTNHLSLSNAVIKT